MIWFNCFAICPDSRTNGLMRLVEKGLIRIVEKRRNMGRRYSQTVYIIEFLDGEG